MTKHLARPWHLRLAAHLPALASAVALTAPELFAAPQNTAQEGYGLGRPADRAAVARIDIDVMPDGRGLPEGEGNAREGRMVYEAACVRCHGREGRDGTNGSLAGVALYSAAELAEDRSLKRTVGNYWPYATTLFDYLRRAMPFDKPGSLSNDELYAVTAYVLHLNGLVKEGETLDAGSLPRIDMPARERFLPASEAQEQP
ncbi:MAG: cytochrome c [Pseudomonadota bacterium]